MDYPHQIDFVWLASDANGGLAALITAGQGPIPASTLSAMREDRELEAELLDLPKQSVATVLSDSPNPWSFRDLAERGLFVYDWNDIHIPAAKATGRYHLVARPSSPLRLEDLPAALRLIAEVGRVTARLGEPYLAVSDAP